MGSGLHYDCHWPGSTQGYTGRLGSLASVNKNSEFQTMGRAMGNHSTEFPKKWWQFTDNNEKSVESHIDDDWMCSGGTWP